MPSIRPTTLRVWVRRIGRIGYSISVEISANRLANDKRNEFRGGREPLAMPCAG